MVHSAVSTADLDVADVARVGVVGIAQTRTEVGTQVLVDLVACTSLQTETYCSPSSLLSTEYLLAALIGSMSLAKPA